MLDRQAGRYPRKETLWPSLLARRSTRRWGAIGRSEACSRSGSAAAADRLIEAEEKAEAAWNAALTAIRRELDEAGPENQAELHRALKKLKKGKVPEPGQASPETKSAIEAFAGACDQADRAGRQAGLQPTGGEPSRQHVGQAPIR